MSLSMILQLLGGLGLLVFGVHQMGEGLQKAAGKKFHRLIELLTTNRFAGVAVGALVTALVQSSSVTTVMTVGFVNAGIMTLQQAIGVIMGANIGTTVTAQLIAFNLTDLALPALALGAFLVFFTRKKKLGNIGQVIMGFGLMFLGLSVMKESMNPLAHNPAFLEFFKVFGKNPILGVLIGIFATALVQSSFAIIGIIISLASIGLIDYQIALPILLGSNIGTTIAALLSSIGTKIAARRAAVVHLLFNVLGTTIFILLFYLIPGLPQYLQIFFTWVSTSLGTTLNIQRLIANTHSLFNLINTLLWLPFTGFLARLVIRIVPGSDEIIKRGPIYIDDRMLKSPAVALEQIHKEILRMADLAYLNVGDSRRAFIEENVKLIENVYEREEVVDALETHITEYLIKLLRQPQTESNSVRLNNFFHLINDIERIGDHAENIIELAEYKIQERLPFSKEAIDELNTMFDRVMQAFEGAINTITSDNLEKAIEVLRFEDEVDQMERAFRGHHIKRLNEGSCFPASGIIFLDVISNLERIGDHAAGMARIILTSRK